MVSLASRCHSSFRPRAGLVGLPPSHRTDDGVAVLTELSSGLRLPISNPLGAQGSCPGWKLILPKVESRLEYDLCANFARFLKFRLQEPSGNGKYPPLGPG